MKIEEERDRKVIRFPVFFFEIQNSVE